MRANKLRIKDLAHEVRKKLGCSQSEAVRLVEIVFGHMKSALIHGEEVRIEGFGHFTPRLWVTRVRWNAFFQRPIRHRGRRRVHFRPFPSLKDRMNEPRP